jgi:hypothetical protein
LICDFRHGNTLTAHQIGHEGKKTKNKHDFHVVNFLVPELRQCPVLVILGEELQSMFLNDL